MRPQVGQATIIGPRCRRFSDLRMSQQTGTSSLGSAVSETRIVSPMPSASRMPMPTALRTEPGARRARFGDAQVQGVGDAAGDVSIGRHHSRNVEGLQGDLDEVEVHLFQEADLPEGGLHHALMYGGWYLTLGKGRQRRQAARIHPHPDGHPTLSGLPHHAPYLLRVADVAGVEAQAVDSGLERRERQAVIEVDVGDDRHRAVARRISGRAAAACLLGTATRTSSHPSSASSRTC